MQLLMKITAAIIVVGLAGWQTPAQAASGNAKEVKRAASAYTILCNSQMARESSALQLTSKKVLEQQKRDHRRQLREMSKQHVKDRAHLQGSKHTTERRRLMKEQDKERKAAFRRFVKIEKQARADAKQQIITMRAAHKAKRKQVKQAVEFAMAAGIIIPQGGGGRFPECRLPR